VSGIVDAVRAALGDDTVAVVAGFGPVSAEVPASAWAAALEAAKAAGATYADFLTAWDELDAGIVVVAHVSTPDAADHVLLRTRVPSDDPVLDTSIGVYRGLAWHERETHDFFGVRFAGHEPLEPLLIQPELGLHPLRKDVVLASRAARPWPGEKEPGAEAAPARRGGRRRTAPLGVPDGWVQGEEGGA
jgi:NADH-quinone oxidoreductase subunit C